MDNYTPNPFITQPIYDPTRPFATPTLCDGNAYEIPRSVRSKKNSGKKYASKKNNHTQDNIYVVLQFTYVYRVAGISLLSRKNTKRGSSVFFSLKNYNNKTLTAQSLHSMD